MVVLNLCALIPLCPVVLKLLRNYSLQKKKGIDPVFRRSMIPGLKNVECWDDKDDSFEAVGTVGLRI
jgi:AGCS family alanine or glycine:cation symporter